MGQLAKHVEAFSDLAPRQMKQTDRCRHVTSDNFVYNKALELILGRIRRQTCCPQSVSQAGAAMNARLPRAVSLSSTKTAKKKIL
ncbi:hypothetical protein EVAR_68064_1 [Eumeta japonica]|uniref:Uncharacterized protein n=1 Tax=Eumeta variegata TaxID=151549 RepID=A0A4C1ZTT9_EUMVA|nr:hypothetical protein EVAR_68064_1 [Eumeta japonica]